MKPAVVIRHRKENLKKCSLRGLENRDDFLFYTYPKDQIPSLENYVLLSFDGEPLTEKDQDKGIVIIDGTWKLAGAIYKNTPLLQTMPKRSLPSHFRTAYPRKQEDCEDPSRGLASIEAVYVAHSILKKNTDNLLDLYHWKEKFLNLNF